MPTPLTLHFNNRTQAAQLAGQLKQTFLDIPDPFPEPAWWIRRLKRLSREFERDVKQMRSRGDQKSAARPILDIAATAILLIGAAAESHPENKN